MGNITAATIHDGVAIKVIRRLVRKFAWSLVPYIVL
jgi:hypothetical protein